MTELLKITINHKTLLEEQLTWREGLIQSIASQGKQQIYKYDAHQFLKKAGSFDYHYAKDGSGGYGLKQGEDWFREGPGKTLFSSVEVPKMVVGEAENARNLQVLVNGKLKHHFPVEGKKRWSAEVDLPAGQTSTVCARVYDFEGLFEEDICNIEVPAEASSCDYDSEGRIIKRTYTNGKVQTFEWNVWGQLEKMGQEDPSGNNYTFTAQYDPLGRRIEAIFKDQKTTYVYNPDVEFETLGHKDNTGAYWHHQSPQGLEAIEDSRGTLTSLINNVQHHGVGHLEGSKVVHYNSPTPYGKIPGKKGLYQSYRGKPYDPTGLIYMGARYYDPEEAQFLSPDPYGYTGNTNLYTYANGDPINYYDPDGRLSQKAHETIAPKVHTAWMMGSALQKINMDRSFQFASNMIHGYDHVGDSKVVQAVIPDYLLDITFGSAARISKSAFGLVKNRFKDFALKRQRSIAAKHIKEGRKLLKETLHNLNQVERNQIIHAFVHDSFRVRHVKKPIVDYRYYDDVQAKVYGRWTTPIWIDSPVERISLLALPENMATKSIKATHNSGSIIFEGIVAPQLQKGENLIGGLSQRMYVKGPKITFDQMK